MPRSERLAALHDIEHNFKPRRTCFADIQRSIEKGDGESGIDYITGN